MVTCSYFLLAYSNGSHRLSCDGAWRYLRLPDPQWLHHRYRQHNIDAELKGAKLSAEIVSLVECSWGPLLDTVLSPLSAEAAVLHSYYRRPHDSVVLHLERTHVLRTPLPVRFHKGGKATMCPQALSAICAEDPAEWLLDCRGSVRHVRDVRPTSGHIVV